MSVFDGRPDLLLLFITQVAFIIIQILIYLRLMREEKQHVSRSERIGSEASRKTSSKKNAKRFRAGRKA